MIKFRNIKGILLDLEGVLYIGDKIIPGSIETVQELYSNNFKIRYLTNTTTKSRNLIFQKLKKMNFPIKENDIFSPSIAVKNFLYSKKIKNIFLMTNQKLFEDFSEFIIDEDLPQAVILGDVYKDFNWDNINKVFQLIKKNDSIIIALHVNRYCRRENKISLDLGPFVKAIEYATSKKSIVIGKPEKNFFDLAISDLSCNKNEIIMVGDDIKSDIEGAKKNNIRSIQVKTGKYQVEDEQQLLQPDFRIPNITELTKIIDNN